MNIYVLDSALERVGVIDYYKSIIWTRRYYEPGDFELCIEATPENIALCRMGRMLYRDVDCDSNTGAISSVMIIEYKPTLKEFKADMGTSAIGNCFLARKTRSS